LYDFLFLAQKSLTGIPVTAVQALAALIQRTRLFSPFMRRYRRAMEPAMLGTAEIPAGGLSLLKTEGVRSA
jgi:hypothetical protein